MDSTHPLKALLQLQLASDAYAVLHLPYILDSLNSEALRPSQHTQKWSTRVNSLIHSKDAGARWAGLCIAFNTSFFSRDLMLECAQSWVTAVVPLLSKKENIPILKAAIRLLRYVFTNATDVPEFQRQVSTPNVPKFSLALVTLADKHEDQDIKVLALDSLSHLIPIYPTLHRALHASLSALALRFLNGSTPKPTTGPLLEAASRLYSVLHHTGGKVGSASHWRKSVDDTLSFAWGAFMSMRTTFPSAGQGQIIPPPLSLTEDPIAAVPFNLDRLKAAVQVLVDLIQTSTPRPVMLPIGQIVRICVALISCNSEDKLEGHADPTVRSLEQSVVPSIWTLGCKLIQALATCTRQYVAPHLSQLLFYLARHLEQDRPAPQRLLFLHTVLSLLQNCLTLGDALLPSRLTRAVLPSLTVLLHTQFDAQRQNENAVSASVGKSRKGKKRARGYEGDEVFKTTREITCPTKEDGEIILTSLEVLRLLILNAPLTSPVQSLSGRIMLSIYVSFPQIPPSLLSPDLTLHTKIYQAVQRICTELGAGSTSTMSKSLGLVIGTSLNGSTSPDILNALDLLLHARVPPLIRALPHVESLAMFRAEESQEETEIRHTLGVGIPDELHLREPPNANQVAAAVSTPIPFTSPSAPPVAHMQIDPVQHPKPSSITSPGSASREQPSSISIQGSQPSSGAIPVSQEYLPSLSKATLLPPSAASPSPLITVAPAPPVSTSLAPSQGTMEADEDEPMPSIDMDSDSDAE